MIRKPKNAKETFVSHIRPNGGLLSSQGGTDRGRAAVPPKPLEPHLIGGEVIAAQTQHVIKLVPYSLSKEGVDGALCVTNFKIHFIPYDEQLQSEQFVENRRNRLIADEDIILNSIDSIYQVSGGRRKKLTVSTSQKKADSLPGRVKKLEIHCKDFRIHRFSFKETPKAECKNVMAAIMVHAFQTRHDLLFAFACETTPEQDESSTIPKFDNLQDWSNELSRLKVTRFREVSCNAKFQHCTSYPEVVVVPSTLMDFYIDEIAPMFVENRWPVWSYTYNSVGSLVRMGHIAAEALQKDLHTNMEKAVRQAHPLDKYPVIIDLNKQLPSIREIQNSYEKLRDLCMPVSAKAAESGDSSYLSHLDKTDWLSTVSKVLAEAQVVSEQLQEGFSVILKEQDSRDLCPLISSLAQIYLDPMFRSIEGFQTLIEKEWVALGHPFAERLRIIREKEGGQECPTFLLFLDCVWQLQKQYPSAFQFSEIYLSALWDSVCFGFFNNFIFDNARDRQPNSWRRTETGSYSTGDNAPPHEQHEPLCVWNWSVQYRQEYRDLFYNPLYLVDKELNLDSHDRIKIQRAIGAAIPDLNQKLVLKKIYTKRLTETWKAEPAAKSTILTPNVRAQVIELWRHCYLRWVSPVTIIKGGDVAQYLQQSILVQEIMCLKRQLKSLKSALATSHHSPHRPGTSATAATSGSAGSGGSSSMPVANIVVVDDVISCHVRDFPADELTSSYPYRDSMHGPFRRPASADASSSYAVGAGAGAGINSKEDQENQQNQQQHQQQHRGATTKPSPATSATNCVLEEVDIEDIDEEEEDDDDDDDEYDDDDGKSVNELEISTDSVIKQSPGPASSSNSNSGSVKGVLSPVSQNGQSSHSTNGATTSSSSHTEGGVTTGTLGTSNHGGFSNATTCDLMSDSSSGGGGGVRVTTPDLPPPPTDLPSMHMSSSGAGSMSGSISGSVSASQIGAGEGSAVGSQPGSLVGSQAGSLAGSGSGSGSVTGSLAGAGLGPVIPSSDKVEQYRF